MASELSTIGFQQEAQAAGQTALILFLVLGCGVSPVGTFLPPIHVTGRRAQPSLKDRQEHSCALPKGQTDTCALTGPSRVTNLSSAQAGPYHVGTDLNVKWLAVPPASRPPRACTPHSVNAGLSRFPCPLSLL